MRLLLQSLLTGCVLFASASADVENVRPAAVVRRDPAGPIPRLVAHAAQPWARYKSSKKAKRGEPGSDTNPIEEPVPVPVPQPGYSPIPHIDGKVIEQSVQTQIKNDVQAAISEFTKVPPEIQNVVKTVLNQIMNQRLYQPGLTAYSSEEEYQKAITQQYKTVADSIDKKLEQIESSLTSTVQIILTPDDMDSLDDRANINALRECINTIVAKGGRRSETDGSCISTSGFSLDSLRDQFKTFTNVNLFDAPVAAVDKVVADVDAYLQSVELVPATEDLIKAATNSIENVVKTVSDLERIATQKAFDCFLEALTAISDVPLSQRERLCNQGNGNGVAGTALQDLQTAYISRVNQYASGLPPIVARQIQQIGVTTMTLKVGSYDEALRDEINIAINSQVSSTAGETNEIVAAVIACLNTLYDDNLESGKGNTCNPNTNESILNANANVYRDYLNTFVSILPKRLVEAIGTAVRATLESPTGPQADELNAKLAQLFDEASLGTKYSDCTQGILACTVQALVAGTATTDCTDDAPAECKQYIGTFPPFSPGQLGDTSDPYGGLGDALEGDGNAGGAANYRRKRARRIILELVKTVNRVRGEQQKRRTTRAGRR